LYISLRRFGLKAGLIYAPERTEKDDNKGHRNACNKLGAAL